LWPILAELGVGTIYLTGAERVEKSYYTSKVLEPEKVSLDWTFLKLRCIFP
jgi:hypothetical protein